MQNQSPPAQASDEPMRACPFCGTDDVRVYLNASSDRMADWDHHAECKACGAMGQRCKDEPAAAAGWNHRVTSRSTADVERDELAYALEVALDVIDDYLDYEHNGDPWTEDARAMGEMDINDYGCDGRMEAAKALLAATKGAKP